MAILFIFLRSILISTSYNVRNRCENISTETSCQSTMCGKTERCQKPLGYIPAPPADSHCLVHNETLWGFHVFTESQQVLVILWIAWSMVCIPIWDCKSSDTMVIWSLSLTIFRKPFSLYISREFNKNKCSQILSITNSVHSWLTQKKRKTYATMFDLKVT